MNETLQMRNLLGDISSYTMYLSICCRKSTPPQNRQLNLLSSNSKQQVDGLEGVLTASNHLMNILCEMTSVGRNWRIRQIVNTFLEQISQSRPDSGLVLSHCQAKAGKIIICSLLTQHQVYLEGSACQVVFEKPIPAQFR